MAFTILIKMPLALSALLSIIIIIATYNYIYTAQRLSINFHGHILQLDGCELTCVDYRTV